MRTSRQGTTTRVAAGLLCLLVAACVPSRNAVFGPVDRDIERRLGVGAAWGEPDARVSGAVRDLLAEPLDLDAAIRVGVASNRHLQARFDELGIAASEVASATVLAPTEVDLSYKVALTGDGSELEASVLQDVLGLLQIGQRRGAARSELAAARARAVAATVELASEIEAGFVDAVAAQQQVELRQTAFDAADASAELAERMHAAGNIPDLALAREQDRREQARADLAHAQLDAAVARDALGAVLGLGEDTPWTTIARLPELPEAAPEVGGLEAEAVTASLELVALDADGDAASGRLRVAQVRAWLPDLGVGVAAARDHGSWEVGPAVRIGLPIFDRQQGPRARARAEARRARSLAAATEVDLRARARAVTRRVVAAYDAAVHVRDVILPLRQEVLNETLKQYNAMNASTFELLTARTELVEAGEDYVEALRQFWIARADARALSRGGMPPSEESP